MDEGGQATFLSSAKPKSVSLARKRRRRRLTTLEDSAKFLTIDGRGHLSEGLEELPQLIPRMAGQVEEAMNKALAAIAARDDEINE